MKEDNEIAQELWSNAIRNFLISNMLTPEKNIITLYKNGADFETEKYKITITKKECIK